MVKPLWALVVVIVLLLVVGSFTISRIFASQPPRCQFPTGIYCENTSFGVEHNSFTATLKNDIGKDIIISDTYLWSEDSSLECWRKGKELLSSNGEQKILVMECTPFERNDALGRFSINFSYLYVNGSGTTSSMGGELYVSRETIPPRLPGGTILTGLVLLAYILVIRWLWGQVMRDGPQRQRIICLCVGIICSLVVIALILGATIFVLMIFAEDSGTAPKLGAAIGIIVLAILFSQAPRLINWNQKRRVFIRGVRAYAEVLGLLHFFALIVWYFGILTPT